MRKLIFLLLPFFAHAQQRNVILIVIDDFGYEIPTCNGGSSYNTHNIDTLSQQGTRFTNFRVCPNCSPSRVALITGKHGFRNYTAWGRMDTSNVTIANVLSKRGYSCAVFGKWQFDGGDASIRKFGFDTYNVFEPLYTGDTNEISSRYKNPTLYSNSTLTAYTGYCDDILLSNILDFTDTVTKPCFIYYALSLSHVPFCPTPDDSEYVNWDENISHINGKRFFPSMVKHVDSIIGEIKRNLPNDIIIVMGDNGTSSNISSVYNGDSVHGSKGNTDEFGIHVPLIVYGLGQGVNTCFVDLPDIYATILDSSTQDGKNIFNNCREYNYGYWSPKTKPTSTKVVEWIFDGTYKVYGDGKMYNDVTDPYELLKIKPDSSQRIIKNNYLSIIAQKHN